MSIIPVGKRKDQVNQGPLQNQSILDSVLFKKFGQGIRETLAPDQKQKPGLGAGGDAGGDAGGMQQFVNDALDQGSLNAPGRADQHEQQFDPMNPNPQSPQGVMPAGAPADQFLGRNEDEEEEEGQQADQNQIWNEERSKIRQFVKNRYKFRLKENTDGTMTVFLTPGGNRPVRDPTGFVDGLVQYLNGAQVNEEETPSEEDVGQPIMITYRPASAGPQKIQKGTGKGRR